jgi:glutathione S-transferase
VLQWMFFEQYDIEPNIAVARFWLAISGEPGKYADALPAKLESGNKALAALERHLAGRSYLVGERLSIADIALYGYVHVADEGGFELGRYPAVQAWIARVAAEPGHITIDA